MIRGFVSKILGNLIVLFILTVVIIILCLLAICWMIPGSSPCDLLKTIGFELLIPS